MGKWGESVRNAVATAVVGAIVGLAVWYSVIESRFAALETKVAVNTGEIDKLRSGRDEDQRDLDQKFSALDAKITQVLLILSTGRPK